MKLSKRIMLAKSFEAGHQLFLALTAVFFTSAVWADVNWPTADDKKNAYWEDVWGSANDQFVFSGVSEATISFRSYISLPSGKAVWVDNSNIDFQGDDANCGLQWNGNAWGSSVIVGRDRGYGVLTIKKGAYDISSALKVGAGVSGGKLVLTNCTVTVADGVFAGVDANGASGEIVVNAGAVLNSTASSGDKFAISKGDNGHTGTAGSLTINGGVVNVASDLYTCQDSGTGTITINDGELNVAKSSIISRGWYTASSSTVNINGGKYWTGNAFELAAAANRTASEGTLNMNDGELAVGGHMYLGGSGGGASRATVNMDGGTMSVTNHMHIADGSGSVVKFNMNGGEIYCGDQFWLGNGSNSDGTFVMTNGNVTVNSYTCVGYGSGGTGHFIMNGGSYYENNEKFIIGQANGSEGTYGECIVSNGTINVPTLWVAENKKPGTLTMEGGEFIVRGEAQMSRNTNASKGTINLNGGVLAVHHFSSSSGTGGEVTFNGGILKALDNRGDWIPNIGNCEFKIAAGGAVFDTNGKNVTIADTLANADGLVGNGTIAKKGLGTLTISSNLDLERTFKFTINNDLGAAGVGTIALTGSNTLETGDKITVEIDPVNAETNVAYTVMTGLGAVTMGDIVLTGTDFYTYTGEVTDGTLSVTLQYGPTAPITARYDNGAWGVYNYNNELIPNGTATNLTTYVFNGSEPAGDFATYAAVHKVLLESGTIAIDSAVLAGHVAVADGATVTIDASGAASFAVDSLVNNGTLIFDGDITLDALLSSGTISIDEGAVLHLARTQTVAMPTYVAGTGEIVVEDGVTLTLTDDHVDENGYDWAFKNFAGTLTLAEGSILSIETGNHNSGSSIGNNATLKMAGGAIARFSRYNGGSNNERIKNLIIEDNTVSTWTNSDNRYGNTGCVLTIEGNVTGGGTLQIYTEGFGDNNRGPIFSNGLLGFTGEIQILHGNCRFPAGIQGGTVVLEDGTHIRNENGNAITVANATLVLKGDQGEINNGNAVMASGTYTIGADATLKVADDASVEGITFAAGATLELLDDGALSDKTQTYVALTSKTPIAGPLPSLVQSSGLRGKWKLLARKVTEDDTTVYQLCAEFRPAGLVIIVQ